MTDTNQLPPLPEPHCDAHEDAGFYCPEMFTGNQMRSYALQARAQATQTDVTDVQILEVAEPFGAFEYGDAQGDKRIDFARAILALRPAAVPMTERELELIDGMIAVQLDHAQRCDAISNRDMAEKQKGWDMERVELLRRIRSFGITAQAKKETP